MKHGLIGFAFAALLATSAVAQTAMPPKTGDQAPMAGQMSGMTGEQPEQMREMMRQMMVMMGDMQNNKMTPEQQTEMMKQMMPMMQKMMSGMAATASPASASGAAFAAAAAKMHSDMPMSYTADADVDYAKGMIPHHEGAIAMSNVLLQYGKNPEMKKFAQNVIKAQAGEIKILREWLVKNGK